MSTFSVTNAMSFWVGLSFSLSNGRWGECLGKPVWKLPLFSRFWWKLHTSYEVIYFSPQLSVPAQINAYVQPAPLPTVDTPELLGGTSCTVSGWGVTRIYSFYLSPILRAVDVSIISYCQYYYYYRVNDNMVCAGSRFGGKDACQVIRGSNANQNFLNPGGNKWNRAQQVPPTFSVAFAPVFEHI